MKKIRLSDVLLLFLGDTLMALAFKGAINKKKLYREGAFSDEISEWQEKAHSHINRRLGFVLGIIHHKWHGSIKQRRYTDRRKIINSPDFPYKPNEHIYYDTDGLIHFHLGVREYYNNQTRYYFLSRQEDAK